MALAVLFVGCHPRHASAKPPAHPANVASPRLNLDVVAVLGATGMDHAGWNAAHPKVAGALSERRFVVDGHARGTLILRLSWTDAQQRFVLSFTRGR